MIKRESLANQFSLMESMERLGSADRRWEMMSGVAAGDCRGQSKSDTLTIQKAN